MQPNNKMEEAPNDICRGCLKWERFGRGCHVFWEGKKVCTMRVLTEEEWANEIKA